MNVTVTSSQRRKEICKVGHPLVEGNVVYNSEGWRECYRCKLDRNRRYLNLKRGKEKREEIIRQIERCEKEIAEAKERLMKSVTPVELLGLKDWMYERRLWMRDLNEPEPPPRASDKPDMWLEVMKDMKGRRRHGIRLYGTPLQPFNGRSFLRDAYQEVLDLAVYMRGKIWEEEHPLGEGIVESLKRLDNILKEAEEDVQRGK